MILTKSTRRIGRLALLVLAVCLTGHGRLRKAEPAADEESTRGSRPMSPARPKKPSGCRLMIPPSGHFMVEFIKSETFAE